MTDSLFDARLYRDTAMAEADAHADEMWKDLAARAITARAASREPFTSDDIWDDLAATPEVVTHEPRALGPVIVAAKRAGVIRAAGYRPSARRHATPITVWVGP